MNDLNELDELDELDELLGEVETKPKRITEHSVFRSKAIQNYKDFMSGSFREFGYGLAKRTNLRLDYLKIISNHIYQSLIEKEKNEKRRRAKKSKSVSAV